MEGFTFKNLSDIDALDRPTDKTKLVGMENGAPVQIPVGGLQADRVFVIDMISNDWEANKLDPDYGDKVKAALLRGDVVWAYNNDFKTTALPDPAYKLVVTFGFGSLTNGKRELLLSLFMGSDQCYKIYCHDE